MLQIEKAAVFRERAAFNVIDKENANEFTELSFPV
jgi:hypothetical protein